MAAFLSLVRMSARSLRRALVLGAALLCAVPVSALFVRVTVYFSASFDVTAAPGAPVLAEVGQFTVAAPPAEFVVVPAGSGGVLKVFDLGTTTETTLTGTFNSVFKGQQLDSSWIMSGLQTDSPFHVRLVDDSDTGMIDASFGGDGWIHVGGQHVMPYQPGTSYKFALTLVDPMIGATVWAVSVSAVDGSGVTATAVGVLPWNKLAVKAFKLVRPAGAPAGQFYVDDLKAVSGSSANLIK